MPSAQITSQLDSFFIVLLLLRLVASCLIPRTKMSGQRFFTNFAAHGESAGLSAGSSSLEERENVPPESSGQSNVTAGSLMMERKATPSTLLPGKVQMANPPEGSTNASPASFHHFSSRAGSSPIGREATPNTSSPETAGFVVPATLHGSLPSSKTRDASMEKRQFVTPSPATRQVAVSAGSENAGRSLPLRAGDASTERTRVPPDTHPVKKMLFTSSPAGYESTLPESSRGVASSSARSSESILPGCSRVSLTHSAMKSEGGMVSSEENASFRTSRGCTKSESTFDLDQKLPKSDQVDDVQYDIEDPKKNDEFTRTPPVGVQLFTQTSPDAREQSHVVVWHLHETLLESMTKLHAVRECF